MATIVCARCGYSFEAIRGSRNDFRAQGDLPSFVLHCVNRSGNPGTIRADDMECSDLDAALLLAAQQGQI
jgi:hypothetical protein